MVRSPNPHSRGARAGNRRRSRPLLVALMGAALVVGLGVSPAGAVPAAPGAVPGPPAVTGVAGGPETLQVSWQAPSDTGGSKLTGFTLRIYVSGTPAPWRAVQVPATARSHELDLVDGIAYTVEVAATNADGTGPASPRSAAVVPPFATTTLFTTRQVRDFLGREPTSQELEAVRQALDGGARSGSLVLGMRKTADATGNVDPVARLYSAYFLRTPDAQGLDYWVRRRRAGISLYRISSSFAGSSEFHRRYGTLTNRQFVELVYENVLGRPGDPAGVDFWTSQLDQRRRDRGAVMLGFSESNEYKRKTQAAVHVAVTFLQMLDVRPSSEELAEWQGQVAASESALMSLAETLLADPRYLAAP
jgi:hypothetical protein